MANTDNLMGVVNRIIEKSSLPVETVKTMVETHIDDNDSKLLELKMNPKELGRIAEDVYTSWWNNELQDLYSLI